MKYECFGIKENGKKCRFQCNYINDVLRHHWTSESCCMHERLLVKNWQKKTCNWCGTGLK